MPPKKSLPSGMSAMQLDENAGPTSASKDAKDAARDAIAIEDLNMPRTMVQRIAKGVLPTGHIIQKDSITAFSKSATVFINYISHAANEHTKAAQRRTISPDDVFAALRETGFSHMVKRLEEELAKYNEVQTTKRNEYRRKVKENATGSSSAAPEGSEAGKESAAAGTRPGSANPERGGSRTGGGGGGAAAPERAAKRAKLEGGGGFASVNGGKADEEMGEEEGDEGGEEGMEGDDGDDGEEEEGEGEESDGTEERDKEAEGVGTEPEGEVSRGGETTDEESD